jgi:acrylyl-CoA reductase (NADPH)
LANHASGWWVASDGSGQLTTHFRSDIAESELGDGELSVAVHYSALNYKDALALTGSAGVVRKPPLVPGIDAAGIVQTSTSKAVPVGTPVVMTGNGCGESRHGGLATTVLASADQVIALPPEISLAHAAALGTAGITATLAMDALVRVGVTPESSSLPIAVTGAAGGVGSLAIALLSRAGYQTVAITGRTDESDYLHTLGATEILSRQEFLSHPSRPLLSERFAGAIDQAGGDMLATLLASTATNGTVAACGLAAGSDLSTTVLPFILRGITLVGINSVYPSQDIRRDIWTRLATAAPSLPFDDIIEFITLEEALDCAPRVLSGASRGRVVVRIRD